MRILFVAPVDAQAPLATGGELARTAGGNSLEVCDGNVDRSKLESYLSGGQFDVVHFAQHGNRLGLDLADGTLEVADLLSMLERQTALRLIFINACNSAATGITLHNAMHIPVIAHDAPIEDKAALAFAETFYRALRSPGVQIGTAFERGVHTLQARFRDDARTPQLINGDMADKQGLQKLSRDLDAAFQHFNTRLDRVEAKVDAMNDNRHRRLQTVIVALLAALLIAQTLTPLLNSLLIHLP